MIAVTHYANLTWSPSEIFLLVQYNNSLRVALVSVHLDPNWFCFTGAKNGLLARRHLKIPQVCPGCPKLRNPNENGKPWPNIRMAGLEPIFLLTPPNPTAAPPPPKPSAPAPPPGRRVQNERLSFFGKCWIVGAGTGGGGRRPNCPNSHATRLEG
jgi:hypothetical protein